MTPLRMRLISIAGFVVAGLATIALYGRGWGFLEALLASTSMLVGLQSFAVAVLLRRGILQPGRPWGATPVGQALRASGYLGFAALLAVGQVSDQPTGWWAWVFAGVALAVSFVGLRIENRAQARLDAI